MGLTLYSDTMISLRDSVYKTLRNAILKGELEPGARLMEIHLAQELGVSRTPVREAIRLLEQEGLAVTYPRKGAQVMRMTLKDLRDVIEVRKSLDVLAGTKACDNVSDEVIKRLEKAVLAFNDILVTEDVRQIVKCDEQFHNVIYDAAQNSKLAEIITSLREQMYRYRYEYLKDKTVLDHIVTEHEKILEGIKTKDKESVEKIVILHLDNQYEAIKNIITKQERS